MPGGVAALDFDNDGRLDLFFVNGASQPSLRKTGPEWWNRLYRNLGNWKFEDVTEKAGLRGEGYGMSATAGDYDNDGFTDLLVTGVGFNTLYRNRGDGTFEDVTQKAGIKPTGWSIGGAWFDSDNDGDLDLFIVNYCVWNPATEPFCGDKVAGYRTYCHPKYYAGLPNNLYRNNGDGTFTDISGEAGISGKVGKGMAVAVADFNGDGRIGPVRHQRHNTQLPLPQPRRQPLHGGGPRGRCRRRRRRQDPLLHGCRLPGFRRRRPAGHLSHGPHQRDLPALPQSRQRPVSGSDLQEPHRRRLPAAKRLELRHLRLRQ